MSKVRFSVATIAGLAMAVSAVTPAMASSVQLAPSSVRASDTSVSTSVSRVGATSVARKSEGRGSTVVLILAGLAVTGGIIALATKSNSRR